MMKKGQRICLEVNDGERVVYLFRGEKNEEMKKKSEGKK